MAEAMDPDLLDGLQQHLNMERQAHSAYFAASIWFAERELRGFSRFFQSESANEHSHAGRVGDYLIARGQTIILQALEAPNQTWEAPVDLMATSFLLECDLTTSLQQLYAMAERARWPTPAVRRDAGFPEFLWCAVVQLIARGAIRVRGGDSQLQTSLRCYNDRARAIYLRLSSAPGGRCALEYSSIKQPSPELRFEHLLLFLGAI